MRFQLLFVPIQGGGMEIIMLKIIFICFVSMFFVLGIIALIYDIKSFFYIHTVKTLSLNASQLGRDIEYYISSLANTYPYARIEITNDSKSAETAKILAALSVRFKNVHII